MCEVMWMQRWQTEDRPRGEQYGYWREVVCEAFTPLRPTARGARDAWDRDGLRGWVETQAFGEVNGAEISTCDQTIHHGRHEVSRVEQEVVFVNLMVHGRSVVRQGDAVSLSEAGTLSIVDATRPFRLDYLDDWRAISFRVPIEVLPAGVADASTAVRHSTGHGVASVLADTMRAAWRAGPRLDRDQADGVGAAVASLVATLVRDAPAGDVIDDTSGGAALRESIEHFVVRNLQHGDVTPAGVARHVGLSVYQDAPATFGRTVMELRTERCAADLIDNVDRLAITELAAKWRFSDLSHLNRVFRQRFGCRASEYAHSRAV
jgi:AraC-like DNA-binding protein